MRPLTRLLPAAVLLGLILIAPPAPAAAPTSDPATWKPEILAQYDAIRAMPGMPKEPVISAVKKLAGGGADARPALEALAADSSLPEPQRAMSGIFCTEFIQFDVAALRAVIETAKNPFQRREAISDLAMLGGAQSIAYLSALATQDASLTAYITKELAHAPANMTLTDADCRCLTVLLRGQPEEKTNSTVMLVDAHHGKSDLDQPLSGLFGLLIADAETQIALGLTLAKIHNDSVPALKALTARNRNRFLRDTAILELSAKGPEGKAVLQELLASPDEPLRKIIEDKLAHP